MSMKKNLFSEFWLQSLILLEIENFDYLETD